jgi:hypothetical protein
MTFRRLIASSGRCCAQGSGTTSTNAILTRRLRLNAMYACGSVARRRELRDVDLLAAGRFGFCRFRCRFRIDRRSGRQTGKGSLFQLECTGDWEGTSRIWRSTWRKTRRHSRHIRLRSNHSRCSSPPVRVNLDHTSHVAVVGLQGRSVALCEICSTSCSWA